MRKLLHDRMKMLTFVMTQCGIVGVHRVRGGGTFQPWFLTGRSGQLRISGKNEWYLIPAGLIPPFAD